MREERISGGGTTNQQNAITTTFIHTCDYLCDFGYDDDDDEAKRLNANARITYLLILFQGKVKFSI